jgi:hypothetical protein
MMCLRTEFRRGAAELVQAHNEAVLFSAFSYQKTERIITTYGIY